MKLIEFLKDNKKSFLISCTILFFLSILVHVRYNKVFDIESVLVYFPFVILFCFIFGFCISFFEKREEI